MCRQALYLTYPLLENAENVENKKPRAYFRIDLFKLAVLYRCFVDT